MVDENPILVVSVITIPCKEPATCDTYLSHYLSYFSFSFSFSSSCATAQCPLRVLVPRQLNANNEIIKRALSRSKYVLPSSSPLQDTSYGRILANRAEHRELGEDPQRLFFLLTRRHPSFERYLDPLDRHVLSSM
jgi:hypothetical protein